MDLIGRMRENIKREELLCKGDRVLIGFSGGPDSLCLFHLLKRLKKEVGFTMAACHINHGFRGSAADEDMEFCRAFCERTGVPFFSKSVRCNEIAKKESLSEEEAGRKVRYDFFGEVMNTKLQPEYGKNRVKVALGQNRDDQAETLLFRILRGTGIDGLAGMDFSRWDKRGYEVIRPILNISRKEIEEYCRERGLMPRQDLTNEEALYMRNKIRLNLLPLLEKEYNPKIKNALWRLGELAREERDYFHREEELMYDRILFREIKEGSFIKKVELSLKGMYDLDKCMCRRMIRYAFNKIGLTHDMAEVQIAQGSEIIKKGKTSLSVDFPHNYKMHISYGRVIFGKKEKKETVLPKLIVHKYVSDEKLSLENFADRYDKEGNACFNLESLMAYLGYSSERGDEFIKGLRCRFKEAGDSIFLGFGHKKIKKMLGDLKIPADEREHVFVIALGKEVIWIPEQGFGEKLFFQDRKQRGKTFIVLELKQQL